MIHMAKEIDRYITLSDETNLSATKRQQLISVISQGLFEFFVGEDDNNSKPSAPAPRKEGKHKRSKLMESIQHG